MSSTRTITDRFEAGKSDSDGTAQQAPGDQDDRRQEAFLDSPLTDEHYAMLAEARELRRPIDRGVRVATFNAWSTAIFAVLSVPFALTSPTTLVLCMGLMFVAFNEFKGRQRFRELDERAATFLGRNQLAFAGLLILYASWQIVTALTQPGPYADVMANQPEIAGTLGSIEQLYKVGSLLLYGGLIVFAVIFQGGTALFYFGRKNHISTYRQRCALWVIRVQQFTHA